MYHKYRQDLAGQTFCYLEIDSHTAHAGFETRVGAFLDIIEERRLKKVVKLPPFIE
jgi:predicted nucleotide-binding protein (sugar kinase/HSP70/actin superfamily)